MVKSLKHRKPIVYISLAIYSLLLAFITIEAFIPSGLSGDQSHFFADLSAFFINLFHGPVDPVILKPLSIGDVNDTSYLGKDEQGIPKIAIGTTTLLSIQTNFPKKDKSDDKYDNTYKIEYVSGDKNKYNLVLSSSINKTVGTTNIRIVANEYSDETFQFNVNFADSLKYEYKFKITDLEAPTTYECKVDKTTLKKGESTYIHTKLDDGKRNDYYLRRYLDPAKIERHSSNDNIASIDEFGYIHGINEGNATITYGKDTFDITVSNESIIKPATNEIVIEQSEIAKEGLTLLDYDYIFDGEDDPNDYSALIYPSFSDTSLEDQSFIYEIDDHLKGRIAPYKYDEEGYPVYFDEDNKPCFRVAGYRKEGDVTIKVSSAVDKSIYKEVVLKSEEPIPTSMTISTKENLKLEVGSRLAVSATFTPKNAFNRALTVTCDNDLITINNNNSTSVTLIMDQVGKSVVTVTSSANPELKKKINIEIIAKQAINPSNYDDFHSFIRKATGHFLLFAFTAIFGFIFFYTYIDDKKKLWLVLLLTLSIGFLFSGISELIQLFVKTRSGLWSDVGIDFFGYFVGTFITFGIIALIKFIKNKRNKKNRTRIEKATED